MKILRSIALKKVEGKLPKKKICTILPTKRSMCVENKLLNDLLDFACFPDMWKVTFQIQEIGELQKKMYHTITTSNICHEMEMEMKINDRSSTSIYV